MCSLVGRIRLGAAPLPLLTLCAPLVIALSPQLAPPVGSARQGEGPLPQLAPPVGSIRHGEAPCLQLLNVHGQQVGRGQGRLGPEAPPFHQTQAVTLQEYLGGPAREVSRVNG